MSSLTDVLGLTISADNEFYDIEIPDDNFQKIDKAFGNLDAQIAGGTATALTVSLESVAAYRAGMKITAIAANNNGGAHTTLKANALDALPIYKPGTTTAPKLIAGRAYTFIVAADLVSFFLVASAEGDAVAANVLAGKTFSNDDDTGISGTMVNRGAVAITPGTANQAILEGYHNGIGSVAGDADLVSGNIKAGSNIFGVAGNSNVVDTSAGDATAAQILSGKKAYVDGALVTGTIASKTAATITPGTTDQTIAAGQYLSGAQTISGDADLIAGNIKSGVQIFGVTGNLLSVGNYEWFISSSYAASTSGNVYNITTAKKPIAVLVNLVTGTDATKLWAVCQCIRGGSLVTLFNGNFGVVTALTFGDNSVSITFDNTSGAATRKANVYVLEEA